MRDKLLELGFINSPYLGDYYYKNYGATRYKEAISVLKTKVLYSLFNENNIVVHMASILKDFDKTFVEFNQKCDIIYTVALFSHGN
jgi:hypothetical protein